MPQPRSMEDEAATRDVAARLLGRLVRTESRGNAVEMLVWHAVMEMFRCPHAHFFGERWLRPGFDFSASDQEVHGETR